MAYGLSNGHVTDDATWPWKVKLVTPIRLERNISKTAGFRDSVPKYHQWEMAYGLSNSHVTDEFTWPPKALWGSTVGYPSNSLASCFVCCSLSIILHLWIVTDSDWSSEQPVSDFSPTVFFKNECLNIPTYILFVSVFSYKNTPLCITLHTQVQECCWDLKNSASRKSSVNFSAEIQPKKMWLAGFSAEFFLSQPKLNKKFGWEV